MVTRKLFLKHDKDGTGRIEWESGEAIKFLEEFFWLHKQPPPKIPKPAFHSLYSQVTYWCLRGSEGVNIGIMVKGISGNHIGRIMGIHSPTLGPT